MLDRTKLKFLLVAATLSTLLFAAALPVSAQVPPTAAQVGKMLGYAPADIKKILAGEIVSLPLDEKTNGHAAQDPCPGHARACPSRRRG